MKIITFNKADEEFYHIIVEENSVRNKISESKVSKDKMDYARLIGTTLKMWGVEKFKRYDDWAGTIIIEGELK